ncbi:MAG TPA: hypothetical protein VND96_14350 [Candidatus Micrarchaeaceae archaeon]|nr:hypothetical protein [Candidatus Micrarchaeaceae archaeon]
MIPRARGVLQRHTSIRIAASVLGSDRWLPLTIASTWWVVCFALYLSPWPIAYTHHNALGVTLLMAGTVFCSVIGYRIGVGAESLLPGLTAWHVPVPVVIGFLGVLILVVPTVESYSGYGLFDIGRALANQAAAYSLASQRIAEGFSHRRGVVVAETLFAPFTLSVLPFLALSWFNARKHLALFGVSLVVPVYVGLLEGRSVAFGTAGIVLGAAWLVSRVRRRMRLHRWEIAALIVVAIVLTIGFGAQKVNRIHGGPICPPGTATCASGLDLVDAAIVIFASYASQGFEGLGHALDARWVFGGGISHSPAIVSMVDGLFHLQPRHVVTSQLAGLGWSDTAYWSTALTNIANDLPWPLVPIAIGLQAAILGVAWRSVVERADWLSMALFCYTWLGILFVPQNLQLALSGPTYLGYITLVIWFFARSIMERRNALGSQPSVGSPYGPSGKRVDTSATSQ